MERRAVESLRAVLNWRESTASQIGRTRRSGIPPAIPNFEAITARVWVTSDGIEDSRLQVSCNWTEEEPKGRWREESSESLGF